MKVAKYKPPGFTDKFVERTRVAREAGGYETPEDMARALGIPASTYRKYEARSPMPHHLIPKFVAITGCTYQSLFGKSSPAVVSGNGQTKIA